MIRLNRYILVAVGILVLSVVLPSLYWTIFEKVSRLPNLFYSCIEEDFIIVEGSQRRSPQGKVYSSDEYEEVLPLMFFRQLIADGKMPDTIKGVQVEIPSINRASSFYRYTPRKLNSPVPELWPMLESESGKVSLVMPDDYFRIGKRMEFIVAKTNRIDEEKSRRFTEALTANGFLFPASVIAGLPTTRKSVDDGYFITDRKGDLFHVKMVQGEPYVAAIETPDNFDIVYIEPVDLKSREYYCYILTRNNGIFVLMDEVYDLQRLPIDGFDPYLHSFRLNADLFNKSITVTGENWFEAVAMDDMYHVVATYGEKGEGLYERRDGKMFASLFPFEIRLKEEESQFRRLFFRPSPGIRWLPVNMVAVGLSLALLMRRGRAVRQNIPDLIIIAVTGIYGLIATSFFPNKFNSTKSANQR